jgi:hypothetical protein
MMTSTIDELIVAFETCVIPRAEWNHRAHLAMALFYLRKFGRRAGARRIREGLLRYNAALGIEQTLTGGYHETITRFYTWLAQRFLDERDNDGASLEDLLEEFCACCGDREYPLQYYTKDRLMSWAARTTWVEPDVQPLDRLL